MTFEMTLAATLGLAVVCGFILFAATHAMRLSSHVKKLAEQAAWLAEFFKSHEVFEVKDEVDDVGRYFTSPSQFSSDLARAVGDAVKRKPVLRHRVLVDITPKDALVRKELVQAQGSGDGRWLGLYLELSLRDQALNRRLLDLRRHHEAKGWTLVSIEPAYDHGDSLTVWLELEREVPTLRELERRAA